MSGPFDVLVIGEVLLELSAPVPLETASELRLGFSGDALNAAAAARAAGARVGLLTRVGDDELGDRLVRAVAGHGIDVGLVSRVGAPNGAYLVGADPGGERSFVYLRRGSAASGLTPSDLDPDVLAGTRVLLVSGVTQALSPSCAATVSTAAAAVRDAGGRVLYDPNFRPRLTSPAAARAALAAIAPHAALVTPSAPSESQALLGTADPAEAAARVLAQGAGAVAVTCGADGVLLQASGGEAVRVPAAPAPRVVDQTGAGDVFAGTVAARLALGDALEPAARLGAAAAALSLAGQGGTGAIAPLARVRAHG